MFRSRNALVRESRWTTKLPDAGNTVSWADLLIQEPVLDDGRRSNSVKTPPVSPTTGDRYIVGYNASGLWSSLQGELVTWNGSSWATPDDELLTGSLVYSEKRNEYLELTELLGATILPALTPELLQTTSPAPSTIKFWIPQHLVDTLGQVLDQGPVRSRTVEYSSFSTEEYYRYIVKDGDATIPGLAGYVATLVTDMTTHASYWVFHKPAEGSIAYIDDVDGFYYYNGTTWVLLNTGQTGGTYDNLFIAEGRQAATLGSGVLQAAAEDTWYKIDFPYSAISSITVCPLSFFTAGGTDFTAPRAGYYGIGFTAANLQYSDPIFPIEAVHLAIKVDGTIVIEAVLPDTDDFEGLSYHGFFQLAQGEVVTLEYKCVGDNWEQEFTIVNGPNLYVYTADGSGGDLIPHALGSHTDTTFGTPTLNDVVMWDGTKWVNGAAVATAGAHTIIGSSHSDSLLNGSLTARQVLVRNSGNTKWINDFLSLDDLSNVALTSPTSGQILVYNGTNFVNQNPSTSNPTLDSLANVNTLGKAVGNTIIWNGSAWVPYTFRLDDLFDVAAPSPAVGQTIIWNGSNWVPGNPTASMNVPYWAGTLSLLSPPTWTAYSTGGGTFTLTRVGGPSGWIFWTPPTVGTYEMIVTGSITFTPGGVNGSFGIYLSNTGAPLGTPGIIGTSALGSMTIAAHATAYLNGNTLGFAMAAGSGGSIGATYLNLTIKRIGD